MTPEQMCYWLQGYIEMGGPEPTPEQWQMIKDHLQTVFTKVTPPTTPQTLLPWYEQLRPSTPKEPVYWKPEFTC